MVAGGEGFCCGNTCVEMNSSCCQSDPVPGWCLGSANHCVPCPSGETCYAKNIFKGTTEAVGFYCCSADNCPSANALSGSTSNIKETPSTKEPTTLENTPHTTPPSTFVITI